ncbi:hypothetical protein SAMN05443549_104149 [Flavobacterium fluvii]|uniref:Uncharacterized protein n=1 Tax=Flavobacterium fluvii TaxID=468056 RepID=A0A1M5K259_9FLAO|nr:hypothetical protein SAMN05443549_104149 [Flavobacterium fluvii]
MDVQLTYSLSTSHKKNRKSLSGLQFNPDFYFFNRALKIFSNFSNFGWMTIWQ